MNRNTLALCLALVLTGVAVGQTVGRQPKPRPAATAFLLNVAWSEDLPMEVKDRMRTLARGLTLLEFHQRNIETRSPAMVAAAGAQLGVDYNDPRQWQAENLRALARRFDVRYVVAVQVLETSYVEGPVSSNPPAPGVKLTTTAKVKVWAWDSQTNKLELDGFEATAERSVGRPGPDESQLEAERTRAAADAARNVLVKSILAKYRVKKG